MWHLHFRLILSTALGTAVTLALLAVPWRTPTRVLLGWDAGVGLYLALTYGVMANASIAKIRQRAAIVDEGALAVLVLTTAAALASLVAVLAELGHVPNLSQIALGMGTILLSWVFMHSIFALHYAHEFYGEGSDHSLTLWMLGYPEAAVADANLALEHAREIDHASDLMFALFWAGLTIASCGNYAVANALGEELVTLADRNGSPTWRFCGMDLQGRVSALIGKSAHAIQMITAGLNGNRSMGATFLEPFLLLSVAFANGELGQLKEAWQRIDEAMTRIEKTKDKWFEAEVNRVAGEIALKSPESDAAKAETYFVRALAVARQQQAKSWELRAAMSMARLWRDQGKRDAARDLLVPVYGWFTEGFDTRDLKEAKALLGELAS